MRTLTLTLLVAVLALSPIASAQLPAPPPTPIYTIEIQNAAATFPELVANGSETAGFSVLLTLGNVVCAAQVTIPVTLTATAAGAPTFAAFTLEPSVLNMTIAQGPHGAPPAGEAGTGLGDAAVRATITGNITANASVQVTVTASAPPPPPAPEGCQGAGQISAATSAPVVIFANMTAPPPPPVVEPTPEDTPGFEVVALVAAAAVVALVARRRR